MGGNQGNAVEELDVFGENPQARFGHTITLGKIHYLITL